MSRTKNRTAHHADTPAHPLTTESVINLAAGFAMVFMGASFGEHVARMVIDPGYIAAQKIAAELAALNNAKKWPEPKPEPEPVTHEHIKKFVHSIDIEPLPRTKRCKYCGRSFEPAKNHARSQKFCSADCRKLYTYDVDAPAYEPPQIREHYCSCCGVLMGFERAHTSINGRKQWEFFGNIITEPSDHARDCDIHHSAREFLELSALATPRLMLDPIRHAKKATPTLEYYEQHPRALMPNHFGCMGHFAVFGHEDERSDYIKEHSREP